MEFDQFPPTDLADFEGFFSSKTFQKAREIVRSGDVKLLERSSSAITARVQGSEMKPYDVLIDSEGEYDCTCPSEIQPCKHVAAVLLAATQQKGEADFDLNAHLQSLDLAQSRTLLLDLASLPQMRQHLLKRVLIKSAGIPKGAIKALKKVLDGSKSIEDEGDLGEAAFAELAALAPDERSDEAWQIYELLDTYEPDYDYYDPEEESGDAYWEDRQSDWMALALKHWGTAEAELGRGEAALKTILPKIGSNQEMWEAALETALRVKDGKATLEDWLKNQPGRDNHALGRFRRDFLQHFRKPEEYEQYLRDNLDSTRDHYELVQHLQGQNRLEKALDVAAQGVRHEIKDYRRFRGDIEGTWNGMLIYAHSMDIDPMLAMLTLLREHRPGFEWEGAMFVLSPSLSQYRKLKTHPEFAKERAKILSAPIFPELMFDLLLEDKDEAALEKLLNKHPKPEYAAKVKHLFPKACSEIFKKATIEETNQGSREHYRQAAKWAAQYGALEEESVFKGWMHDLLEVNKRRSALQEEFRQFKTKLR